MTREPQAVRRVRARANRPTGGALWLGPAIGLALGLCALLAFALIIGLRPLPAGPAIDAQRPTAIVVTITPSPVIPTATLPPTVVPPSPTPTPEGLYIGGVAVVNGTGSALRLRSDPGLQTTTLKTVIDGKRLTILEGPREADGLIWWRLRDPSDGAEGWAAQEYLAPATSP